MQPFTIQAMEAAHQHKNNTQDINIGSARSLKQRPYIEKGRRPCSRRWFWLTR